MVSNDKALLLAQLAFCMPNDSVSKTVCRNVDVPWSVYLSVELGFNGPVLVLLGLMLALFVACVGRYTRSWFSRQGTRDRGCGAVVLEAGYGRQLLREDVLGGVQEAVVMRTCRRWRQLGN